MIPRRLSDLIARRLEFDPEIAGVTADSRQVKPGYLFAALPGSQADGRDFIARALDAGAVTILAPQDTPDLEALDRPVALVRACDVRRLYALAASRFHGPGPATVLAVTGTNGKTSVATFCRQIFARLGHRAASLGTLGLQVEDPASGVEGLAGPGRAPGPRTVRAGAGRSARR